MESIDNLSPQSMPKVHSLTKFTHRHDHLLQTEQLMQGPNSHESNGRGTVGIRDQLLPLGGFGVDLRDHQRDAVHVAERRRVVDDHRPVAPLADVLGVLQAELAVHGEEDEFRYDWALTSPAPTGMRQGPAAATAAAGQP